MKLFMVGDELPLFFYTYLGKMNKQNSMFQEELKIVNSFKIDNTKTILCSNTDLASDKIKKEKKSKL